MIQRNPFLSESFTRIWSKHFAPDRVRCSFGFSPSIEFVKNRFLPLFVNVGKTMTKGIGYELTGALESSESYRKKAFLVYDVPGYFGVRPVSELSHLGVHRVKQYPGFLIDLEKFRDLNDYLQNSFSKSSRYKLKKYKKRFEASFDVRYIMYRGTMDREQYDSVFDKFRELLQKRFNDKQITNNNLDPDEWRFYHEVTYPMLLENKASLFVIYNRDEPIGVTLNFFSDEILFDAITVFDIDYAKFHLGSITIMALLDWCFINGLKTFDFSKGYFDYKARWATAVYDFEYHVLYDKRSFRTRTLALGLKQFFGLKQQLREKNVNDQLHRLTYRFKNKTPKPLENRCYSFTEVVEDGMTGAKTQEINLARPENHRIRLMVFEYLYLNEGHYDNVKVYPLKQNPDQFYLVIETKKVLATLESV